MSFDFEYFVKEGLEHFDGLKYHFQKANLLEAKSGNPLLDKIKNKLDIDEFAILFELFLVKKILIKKEYVEFYEMEITLLGYIVNEKT